MGPPPGSSLFSHPRKRALLRPRGSKELPACALLTSHPSRARTPHPSRAQCPAPQPSGKDPPGASQVCIWNIYFRKYISNTLLFIQKEADSQEAPSERPLRNASREGGFGLGAGGGGRPGGAPPRALTLEADTSFNIAVLAKTWQVGK